MENEKTTEQAIIDEAEKLFMEKGFGLTSTTEIAKKVGVNQAMVHYYFRTKEILFEAIFLKKVRLFLSTFMQISKEELPFLEKLKKAIEAHFEVIKANPKLPFLIINEIVTNPGRIQSLKGKIGELPIGVIAQMKSEIEAEIKKGTIRKIEFIDIILMLVSLNVTPFLAKPILMEVAQMNEEEYKEMLERRKAENVRIILNSIKP